MQLKATILFFKKKIQKKFNLKKKKVWHAWRPGQASYSPVPVTPKSFLFSSLPASMTGPPLPAAPGTLSWSLWSRSSPDPPSLGLVLFSCHWLVCCCRCTARRLCSLCPWHFSWLSFLLLFFLNFLVVSTQKMRHQDSKESKPHNALRWHNRLSHKHIYRKWSHVPCMIKYATLLCNFRCLQYYYRAPPAWLLMLRSNSTQGERGQSISSRSCLATNEICARLW